MATNHTKGSKILKHLGGASPSKSSDKLDELATRSSYVIFEAKTRKLFDLFPNVITICPNRITISYSVLFRKYEYPLPIENVTGARIARGFLYSTLLIETFGYEKPEPLRNMKTHDARLARRYILGLVECKKNNVDLSNHNLSELREKLNKIGMVRQSSNYRDDLY